MNQPVRSAVLAVAIVAACARTEPTTSPMDFSAAPGAPLTLVRLRAEPYSFAYYSGLDQPDRIVVRDPVAWEALWARINMRNLPVEPAPAVDFSQDMLVVVALGARSSGGYGILLDGANQTENSGTAVTVRSISPKNCLVTAAFTQPIDIARLPRREGDVTFVERSEVHTCD